MTENDRLRYLQSYLKFNNQTEFANFLGIKQGSLSDIYRSKQGIKVSDSIKRRLNTEYSINIEWIETGEGNIVINNQKENIDNDLENITMPREVFDLMVSQQKTIESQQRTIENQSKKTIMEDAKGVVKMEILG